MVDPQKHDRRPAGDQEHDMNTPERACVSWLS